MLLIEEEIPRPKQLLDANDVAYRLNVHPRTVKRWFKTGYIPGQRVGPMWRIDPDVFENWLRAGRGEGPRNTQGDI